MNEGGERSSHVDVWGKEIPCGGNSQCKVGVDWADLKANVLEQREQGKCIRKGGQRSHSGQMVMGFVGRCQDAGFRSNGDKRRWRFCAVPLCICFSLYPSSRSFENGF